MRKSCLFSMVIVVVLVLSTAFVWADNIETQIDKTVDEIEPAFIYPLAVEPELTITSGVAKCRLDFVLRSGKTLDYIEVTAVLKKSTGSTVKTFNEKMYPKSIPLRWEDTYRLTSRGTYYIDFTVKCYKGGAVKETIKTQSVKKVY